MFKESVKLTMRLMIMSATWRGSSKETLRFILICNEECRSSRSILKRRKRLIRMSEALITSDYINDFIIHAR